MGTRGKSIRRFLFLYMIDSKGHCPDDILTIVSIRSYYCLHPAAVVQSVVVVVLLSAHHREQDATIRRRTVSAQEAFFKESVT